MEKLLRIPTHLLQLHARGDERTRSRTGHMASERVQRLFTINDPVKGDRMLNVPLK